MAYALCVCLQDEDKIAAFAIQYVAFRIVITSRIRAAARA